MLFSAELFIRIIELEDESLRKIDDFDSRFCLGIHDLRDRYHRNENGQY